MKTNLCMIFISVLLISSLTSFSQNTKSLLLGTWVSSTEKVINGENVVIKEKLTFTNDTIYTLSENISKSSQSKIADTLAYKLNDKDILFSFWGLDGKIEILELTESKLSGNFIISKTNKTISFVRENK